MVNNNEPSLSELTNIKGDANQSAGGGSVVLAPDYSVQYLQAAAQAKVTTDKYIYEKFQENLTNNMAGFNALTVDGISEKDYPEMSDRYAKLSAKLADNYDVIRNPQKNLEKFSQLKEEEAKLRSDIMQSKAQKAIIDEHQKFLTIHQEWNTEGNQKKLLDFQNKPRAEREVFTLDAPFTFDPKVYAEAAAKVAQKKMATSSTDGKYNYSKETTTYNDADFNEAALAGLNTDDAFGRSSRRAAENAYNNIPQEEREKFGSFEDWFVSTVSKFKPQNSVDKSTLNENQYGVLSQQFQNQSALQNDAQAHDAWQNQLSRDVQTKLQEMQLKAATVKKEDVDKRSAGVLKVAAMTSVFATEGKINDLNALQTIYGDSTPVKVKKEDLEKGVTQEYAVKKGQVIAATQKDGVLLVDVKNNVTGKITRLTKSIKQADVDFDNILGRDKAGIVADGSRNYLKTEMKMENGNFDLNSAKSYFNYVAPGGGSTPPPANTAAAGNIPSVSSQQQYDALPKGASYIFNGKTLIKK